MIVITGAAGFISSCLISKLNKENHFNLILVDDFSRKDKLKNLKGKKYRSLIHRDKFLHWLKSNSDSVKFIFHLGARTDTTEFNQKIINKLNLTYTKNLWKICIAKKIPIIYASSAATYGLGELGFKDSHSIIKNLKPLNPYGISKNELDKIVVKERKYPPFWAGIKFFNVYGPNEYHKGRMASVIFHLYNQIKKTGKATLFKSHNLLYKNGEQLRDFIYIKDVINVLYFIFKNPIPSGIYNLGTGQARSFIDLTKNVFKSLKIKTKINFIDMPQDIREKYQYFTEADMTKFKKLIKYKNKFHSLEDGIKDYIANYLVKGGYF